jgi:DNA-binding IclR family transcriptional regulator
MKNRQTSHGAVPARIRGAAMKAATTVTKVCRVMEQFRERQSFGISDLARRMELLPSDVHRILTSLRAFGYIEQDPETRKYRLGLSLLRLGLTARASPRPRLRFAGVYEDLGPK